MIRSRTRPPAAAPAGGRPLLLSWALGLALLLAGAPGAPALPAQPKYGDSWNVYPAADASLSHASIWHAIPNYQGEGYAKSDGAEGAFIEWTVTLGLGGSHDVAVRYWTDEPMHGELTVTDAKGAVVARERVHFPLALPTTWRRSSLETPLALGAGTYRFRLTLAADMTPAIDSLSIN